MKVSVIVGSAIALLLSDIPTVLGAPTDLEVIFRRDSSLLSRDFSADQRNFGQIQQLMHNLGSRIGVPFSAMRNVGLAFHQTLGIDPLDLVLLPNGYCFKCVTSPHTGPDDSKTPSILSNQMVELDETQLLVSCSDPGDKSSEWPLMKACPGIPDHVLKDFLLDISKDGSRLAVPKSRLETAPIFQIGTHVCTDDPHATNCSPKPSSTSTSSTSEVSTLQTFKSKLDLQSFLSSLYSHQTHSTTVNGPATTNTVSRDSTKGAISTPSATNPPAVKPGSSPITTESPKTTNTASTTLARRAGSASAVAATSANGHEGAVFTWMEERDPIHTPLNHSPDEERSIGPVITRDNVVETSTSESYSFTFRNVNTPPHRKMGAEPTAASSYPRGLVDRTYAGEGYDYEGVDGPDDELGLPMLKCQRCCSLNGAYMNCFRLIDILREDRFSKDSPSQYTCKLDGKPEPCEYAEYSWMSNSEVSTKPNDAGRYCLYQKSCIEASSSH